MYDFNLLDINWATLTGASAAFCDLIFNLLQPTHSYGNILDLVLTKNKEFISHLMVQSQPPLPVDTDYYNISFDILLIT